jgi:fatty acid desaturase
MQVTMPVWAGHVPHRAPEWLIAIARRFAFTRSAILMSLAYHELHHAYPRVPTADLAELSRVR